MARIDHRHTRRDYRRGQLRRADLAANPMDHLAAWLTDAHDSSHTEPTAMILATAGSDGQPSVRVVLMKHLDDEGPCWYTDSRSLKGQQLAVNPKASILFYWPELERQVRLDGLVRTLEPELADEYFASRPIGSRYAAATSHQSQPIASRDELEQRLEAVRARHPHGTVPRPPTWIGYRLEPTLFQFWQGRENRLHDRFQYTREDGAWAITRLMP
jgi:pyridoxamine 5'-phosphate oxidase